MTLLSMLVKMLVSSLTDDDYHSELTFISVDKT